MRGFRENGGCRSIIEGERKLKEFKPKGCESFNKDCDLEQIWYRCSIQEINCDHCTRRFKKKGGCQYLADNGVLDERFLPKNCKVSSKCEEAAFQTRCKD